MGIKEIFNTLNKKKLIIFSSGIIAAVVLIIVICNLGSSDDNKPTPSVSSEEITLVNQNISDNGNNETATDNNITSQAGSVSDDSPDSFLSSVSTNIIIVSDNNGMSSTVLSPTPSSESGTPVANHGELSVNGTQLVDKNGNAFQLQGVSTHGIGWFPDYVNKYAFQTLRDEWGVNCIRIAMYTGEYNGYCNGGNQSDLKTLVENGVSYATELGMYVIIDWHILSDNDPNINKDEALDFFSEMSSKYASYDNVIYEICNEPNGGTTWSDIKSYALEVIPVIKANNPNAIIIVGTPTWSQDVDVASKDPITGYTNIMYALHFYADTHKEDLRQKMLTAINNGIPIFVTEFGITDASGNGSVNESEGNTWISTLDANGVSYCIWNLSNKNESSALINATCTKTSGWTTSDLSLEGQWYVNILGGNATGTVAPSTLATSSSMSSGAPAATPVTTSDSGNTSASLSYANGWNDGTNNYYQYTLTVKNTGTSTISGWNISINFGTNVTIDQLWNGNVTASGNTVTVKPADFNNSISAGGSAEVGFIIYCSGSVQDPVITIK